MSGSSLLVTEAIIGQTVTFTSKNPVDPTIYKGIVTGIITYALSGSFGFDQVSYSAAVQRADPTVGAITTLNYFIVTLTNNQPAPANRLFANEWISTASFSVITSATIFNLNVYDIPAHGLPAILAILQNAGYNAVQVTAPSAAALLQGQTSTAP